MQQQFELVKTIAFCFAFASLILVMVLLPLLKEESSQENLQNIFTFQFLRKLIIGLIFSVVVFYLALRNELYYPTWAIPFTVILLDFITYLWHYLGHRWSPREEEQRDHAFTHLTEVLNSLIPSLFIVWGMRLPVEALLFFALASVANNLLEFALLKCPPFVERMLALIVMTPSLARTHQTKENGKKIQNNFGIIFSLWDRIFGTYSDPDLSQTTTATANLR